MSLQKPKTSVSVSISSVNTAVTNDNSSAFPNNPSTDHSSTAQASDDPPNYEYTNLPRNGNPFHWSVSIALFLCLPAFVMLMVLVVPPHFDTKGVKWPPVASGDGLFWVCYLPF
jgi:hypothetical protein